MFKRHIKSKYWNGVFTVMFGTVLSQALPILILPFLSRLLPPVELGQYFSWFAKSMILVVVVGLAFESAIFTVDTEKDIHRITRTVFVSASAILLLLWIVWAALFPILGFTEVLGLSSFGLCSIGVFAGLFALQNCLIAAYVYHGNFKAQGLAKVMVAGFAAVFQLCAAFLGFGFKGLVIAQIMATVISTGMILWMSKFEIFMLSLVDLISEAVSTLKRFKKFAMFGMPSLLIGVLSAQLPVIYIGKKFGFEQVAFYSMALKVVAVPIGLVGSSILQVFKQSASLEYRTLGNCRKAYSHTFRNLVVLSIFPMIFVLFLSDLLFKEFFGIEYIQSAHITKLLLPSILLGFVASPLSYTLLIAQKQHWDFIWKVCFLAFVIIIFSLNLTFSSSIAIYSVGYAFFYCIYICMSWTTSKTSPK